MIFSDVFLGDNELTVLQLKNQDDKDLFSLRLTGA
jgi:hypothetical protein